MSTKYPNKLKLYWKKDEVIFLIFFFFKEDEGHKRAIYNWWYATYWPYCFDRPLQWVYGTLSIFHTGNHGNEPDYLNNQTTPLSQVDNAPWSVNTNKSNTHLTTDIIISLELSPLIVFWPMLHAHSKVLYCYCVLCFIIFIHLGVGLMVVMDRQLD